MCVCVAAFLSDQESLLSGKLEVCTHFYLCVDCWLFGLHMCVCSMISIGLAVFGICVFASPRGLFLELSLILHFMGENCSMST